MKPFTANQSSSYSALSNRFREANNRACNEVTILDSSIFNNFFSPRKGIGARGYLLYWSLLYIGEGNPCKGGRMLEKLD